MTIIYATCESEKKIISQERTDTMERKTERNLYQSTIAERLKRKSVHLPAHLVVGDRKYAGFIVNISCRGIGMYVVTKFSEGTIDCAGGSVLTLEAQSPSGEVLSLQCTIKWLRIRKYSQVSLTTSIGMEIIDPPVSFAKLFESLS
jgi:hypothetical protein